MSVRSCCVGDLGQAEVGDPDGALVVEQQVRGLDVAVDDPLAVGVGQRLGRLDADPRRLAGIEPAGGRPVPLGVPRRAPSAPRRARGRRCTA